MKVIERDKTLAMNKCGAFYKLLIEVKEVIIDFIISIIKCFL